jgi:PAS domain S-box-containing protein
MTRMMKEDFWEILKGQPGVGVAIVDVRGVVHYANSQLQHLYGWTEGEIARKTIAELEGPEFTAECLQIIQQVVASQTPAVIRHIRGGRYTETVLWPLPQKNVPRSCVLVTMRQGDRSTTPQEWPVFESKFVHLGLWMLSRRGSWR